MFTFFYTDLMADIASERAIGSPGSVTFVSHLPGFVLLKSQIC